MLKILGIAAVAVIVIVVVVWGFVASKRIYEAPNIDGHFFVKKLKKAASDVLIVPNLADALIATPRLSASLFAEPKGSIVVGLDGENVISSDYLQYRRQYVLSIWNEASVTLSDVRLRIQFPYLVERQTVETAGVAFVPFTGGAHFAAIGPGAAIRLPEHRGAPSWDLTMAELRPGGEIKIRVLLNNRRANEPDFPFVPNPKANYLSGKFRVGAEDGEPGIVGRLFAPLLVENDTVRMGAALDDIPDGYFEMGGMAGLEAPR